MREWQRLQSRFFNIASDRSQTQHDAMTVRGDGFHDEIYPIKYFDASRTWFTWNKLTIRDVHSLREEPGFSGQNIYFYLNHPIQYISVTGIISQIELGGGQSASKFCFFCLDDGSGQLIEVRVQRRPPEERDFSSNTLVDGLDCHVNFATPVLSIGCHALHTGQIVRARGTISAFRSKRQLDLKLIKVLSTTAEEIETWQATARWKRDVLSKPWRLTSTEMQQIDTDIQQAKAKQDEHQRQQMQQMQERALKTSARAALRTQFENRYNDGALPGSEIVKAPWD